MSGTGARLVAHRGASAYAPENTHEAFGLALGQGADAIEHDLQVTSDGVLICLHDRALDRTTNARDMLPSRGSPDRHEPAVAGAWFAHEFTLDEVARLDAGSWFGPAFAGARVPAFDDVLDWARGRTALWAEIKDPEVYEARGVDVLALVEAALRRHGLLQSAAADPPVMVLSFHEPTIRRAAARFGNRVPRLQLIEADEVRAWRDPGRLAAAAQVAGWIGPGKDGLEACPDFAHRAHENGLRVAPWAYRSSADRIDRARVEMARHLHSLHVDAVITDHPDQFPFATRDPDGM